MAQKLKAFGTAGEGCSGQWLEAGGQGIFFASSLCFFLALFGWLEGGKGLGHNLFMQFSTLGISKMEISEIHFFLIF